MKKVLFIILSLLMAHEVQTILWDSNKKIEWTDFQGEPPKDKGLKLAVSAVKISVKYKRVEGNTPDFTVKSFFNRKESWSITTNKSHLSHERLHFDITEVYSRKIRCQLKALKEKGEKNLDVYKETYRKLMKAHGEAQEKYDNEVYFNDAKQQEWYIKVAKELEELKEYEYIPEE